MYPGHTKHQSSSTIAPQGSTNPSPVDAFIPTSKDIKNCPYYGIFKIYLFFIASDTFQNHLEKISLNVEREV